MVFTVQVSKLIEEDENKPASMNDCSFVKSLIQQTVPLFKPPLLKNTLKLFYLVIVIYMT